MDARSGNLALNFYPNQWEYLVQKILNDCSMTLCCFTLHLAPERRFFDPRGDRSFSLWLAAMPPHYKACDQQNGG